MDLDKYAAWVDSRSSRELLPIPPPIRNDQPVGDHLHELLTAIGLQPTTTCQCEQRRRTMNAWGIAGCRERREEIVGWLRESGSQLSYGQQFAAFASLAGESWWNLTDPYGSIVDEAIRRAEQKA